MIDKNKKIIEKLKLVSVLMEDNHKDRYKKLENIFKRSKEIDCYKKIGILQQLDKQSFTLEEIDSLIDMFSKGEVKVVVNEEKGECYIEEGVDDTLENTNPGVWIWSKHPEINNVVYESIKIEKENLNKICIDLEKLHSVIKWTIIGVLNKGMELKEGGVNNGSVSGGGWNYLSGNIIKRMAELLKRDVKSLDKDKNIGILMYLKEKKCNMNSWEDIISHFNAYIESDKVITKSVYTMCNSIIDALMSRGLVVLKDGKFIISNYNEINERPALLYKLNLPKLTNITYSNDLDVIRRKQNREGSIILTAEHYKGLSYLANVKYRINCELLDYLFEMDLEDFYKLTGYKEIDKKEEIELNDKLKYIWGILDNEEDQQYIKYTKEKDDIYKKLEVIKANKSKNSRIFYTLLYAITYSDLNFSFHMFFDARGRIYYKNTYISPQSSDLGKNLIEFANSEKLTDIRPFMVLGYDYYKGRKTEINGKYAILNDSKVYDIVKNIIFKEDMFLNSKSPIDYLNWFLSYKKLYINKDVKLHYIVRYDATCSGTQHISMLLKNIELARSVNIMNDSEYGNDFYSEFVKFVNDKIKNKQTGSGLEKIKLIGVRREVVKKTVMSYAYNAKALSMSNDIKSFFDYKERCYIDKVHGISLESEEMKEYCNIIITAIKNYSLPLTNFLTFLDLWAQVLSYYNLEISWTLPEIEKDEETTITQKYVKIEEKKIKIVNFGKQTTITVKKKTGNIDTLKQRNTFAPNLVHSLDAFHVLSFCKSFTSGFNSYRDIAVIHDCFGVCVKDSLIVKEALYNTYKDMYKNTHILKDMHNKFIHSLVLNGVFVGYDEKNEEEYIIITNYNKKDPLKNLKTDKKYKDKGLKKYLPKLIDKGEKEWIKAFEKDYKEIHSFTP